MYDPKKLLLYLVADLIRAEGNVAIPCDKNLLDAFAKDPQSVMTRYGLSSEARDVLFTMDRQLIGQFILQEILRTPAPPPRDLWSDPLPRIISAVPPKLTAAPGQKLEIRADCVLESAEVHLVSANHFNHFVAKPVFKQEPITLKNEELAAIFDLSGAALGDYYVLL